VPGTRSPGTTDLAVRYTRRVARPRQIQNAVLGTAIAAELIFLIGHPLFGWGPHRRRFAVTPPALSLAPAAPPSARSTLLRLAATAAGQPAPARHRYAYVHSQTWDWTRQVHASGRPDYPRYRIITSWTTGTGHGRVLTVQRTAGGFHTGPAVDLRDDPTVDLDRSRAQLGRTLGLGPGAPKSVVDQFTTVAAVALGQPVPPAAQAKLLALLAADPGLVDSGTTTDRTGRRGVAVSVTSTPTTGSAVRATLVLDPATGGLLEADTTLESSSGRIDVPVGGLLGYDVFLRSGWVSEIGQAPQAATSSSG
jgi:hypothetical protein